MSVILKSAYGLAAVLMLQSGTAMADEVHFNLGGGPQPGSDSSGGRGHSVNTTAGIDYGFFRYDRSERSSWVIGVSYTYMRVNSSEFDHIHAISLYPQLSLYPTAGSWVRDFVPWNGEPYFFVRALGPSYISANRLGSRRQSNNFSFQAQIGVGASYQLDNGRKAMFSVSWKHFSNANLYSDNDGIDLPVVLNFGVRF